MIDLRTRHKNIEMAYQTGMEALAKQATKDIVKTIPTGQTVMIGRGLKGLENPIVLGSYIEAGFTEVKIWARGVMVSEEGITVLSESSKATKGTYPWQALSAEQKYLIHNALRITLRGI